MNRFTENLLYFVTGALVGAAAGLMFAPAKGEDTQKELARKAKKLKRGLDDSLEASKEKIDEIASSIKNFKSGNTSTQPNNAKSVASELK
ncbi:MAG: hypothetical protein OHK0038_02230 [Flammeovirgaceae bacterium]